MQTDNDSIKAEIAEILDKETPVSEAETKDAETVEVETAETPKEEVETPSAEAFSPDDTFVERAVRAGLTLEDAKSFSSKESAERILAAIEAKSASPEKGGQGAEEPAPETPIPEITDDMLEEIDPTIAEFIKSQNAALKALGAEITSLKKAGQSAEAKGFFDTQYGALDEKVRNHVDAVAKTKLKQKFEMLEAGYKATGVKVERGDVFKEAVSLALGDAVRKASSETKAAKVASRRGLVIAPAGGSPGHKASFGGGEYADIVAALQEKGIE